MSSVFALLASSGIFALAFGTIVTVSIDRPVGDRPAELAELNAHAHTLVRNIVGESAQGFYRGLPCDARDRDVVIAPYSYAQAAPVVDLSANVAYDPDAADRFGLASDGCEKNAQKGPFNALDFGAIRALQDAHDEGADDSNGKVDYAESYDLMDLEGSGIGFHLEMAPAYNVAGYSKNLAPMRMQTLYIGHFTSAPLPDAVCTLLPLNLPVTCSWPLPLDVLCTLNCGVVNSAASSTLREANYLAAVQPSFVPKLTGAGFPAYTASNMASGGDVVADDSATIASALTTLLTVSGFSSTQTYNTVVVGSDVSDVAMAIVAPLLVDWVSAAGGYLIVLGNAAPVTWTATLLHTQLGTQTTAGSTTGSIADGFATHGTITVPNDLTAAIASYTPAVPYAWSFIDQGGYEAPYEAPVVGGAPSTQLADFYGHVALARDGAFGNGRILLTSWRPFQLTPGTAADDCEYNAVTASCAEVKALTNFFTVPLYDLFLSYGPRPPSQIQVGTSNVLGTVFLPALGDLVEVRISIQVWRQSGDPQSGAPPQPPPQQPAPNLPDHNGGDGCIGLGGPYQNLKISGMLLNCALLSGFGGPALAVPVTAWLAATGVSEVIEWWAGPADPPCPPAHKSEYLAKPACAGS